MQGDGTSQAAPKGAERGGQCPCSDHPQAFLEGVETAFQIPRNWRKANIAPAFKKERKDDLGNIRPVISFPEAIMACIPLEHIPGYMREKEVIGTVTNR